MGNNQPKYLNSNEAIGIMGDKTWDRLRRQLRTHNVGGGPSRQSPHDANNGQRDNAYYPNNGMDYTFFSKIIQSHFEYMPRLLIDSLFLGFAADLNSKVDIDEFISSLAVISGQNRGLILRFLFRVYDSRGSGHIDRQHVEKILKLAYGYRGGGDIELIRKSLDLLFRTNVGTEMLVSTQSLTFREFEHATVPLRELGEWVQSVLRIFTDPLPSQLLIIERRYSSNITNADIMTKHQVSEVQCSNLRAIFAHKCSLSKTQSLGKQELTVDLFVQIVQNYIPTSLAAMIFLVSTSSLKPIWRLEEFVDFCLIFGRGKIDDQTKHLCQSCYRYYLRLSKSHDKSTVGEAGGMRAFFRRVILILAQSNSADPSNENSSVSTTATTTTTTIPSINLPSEQDNPSPQIDDNTPSSGITEVVYKLESLEDLQSKIFLPATIGDVLDTFDNQSKDPPLQAYMDLLAEFSSYLPGLRELSMTACCMFGVQPTDPSREKEFIMELMVKRHGQSPQTRAQPYGPVGTEWCVVVKLWWDNWRFFVGHKRVATINTSFAASTSSTPGIGVMNVPSTLSHSNSAGNLNSSGGVNGYVPPKHPGEIDNWSILKKSGPKQLLQGTTLHNDIEVIPPSVYHALQMWYGGGPRIQRKVIITTIGNVKATELELFPLCIKICTCLPDGRARDSDREVLMSRMHKISEIISELSESRNIDSNRVRLWNYAQTYWKDQFVLSPDLTLEEANLQDGQSILLEISLNDGTWPRSQLHAQLDEEERIKQQKLEDQKNHSLAKDAGVVTKQPLDDQAQVVKVVTRLNDGKIGLDNLGNTCYLNASLQALLHTEPLIDYFLSQSHLKDINRASKFGYGGKLAMSFSKLVEELYRSNRKNINPRQFVNDLASIHQQFSGNQQQDAQELLTFLLDGLSEDLNLVDEKPYTTQPDSDGRPDAELADIWWENHLKRDLSLIQALFTGQFKSVMTCSCGHSSARFEPFNILAVPIPEDFMRMFTVHVVFEESPFALILTVRVDKRSDLYSVVDVINRLNLSRNVRTGKSDLNESRATSPRANVSLGKDKDKESANSRFVAVEIINSKVHAMFSLERKLEMIRDGDNIFLYETRRIHRGLIRGVRSIQLPPAAEPMFDYGQASNNSRSARSFNSHKDHDSDSLKGDRSPTSPTSSKTDNATNPSPLEPSDEVSGNGTTSPSIDLKTIGIRVAFLQRRIRLHNASGLDSFALDIFGLPFVHVLENSMTGGELYDLIFNCVRPYLKADIADLMEHYASLRETEINRNGRSSLVENQLTDLTLSDEVAASDGSSSTVPSRGHTVAVNNYDRIRPSTNEEVFSGPISRTGFTLRLVVGGTQHCVGCARCHWLSRCQGCVVPDDPSFILNLRDGETLAIDWHIAVFEELLDINAASEVRRHKSVSNKLLQDNSTPLKRCLDKFTEDEPLEGMVCPMCHNDDKLRKSFAIWRLPPVLVIQLKRFQFDNTSRRKLTNRVDFPLEDLDLAPYLAGHQNNNQEQELVDYSEPRARSNSLPPFDSTAYDLYCTVHHIGALGGGHYVTAVKHWSSNISTTNPNSTDKDHNDSNKISNNGIVNPAANPATSSWWLYNDDVTSEIKELKELCSPSAYLLFYIRKDVLHQKATSHDLFAPFRSKAPPRSRTTSMTDGDITTTRNYSNNNKVTSHKGSLISKLNFIPRHRSLSAASIQSKDSSVSAVSVAVSEGGGIDKAKGKAKSFRRAVVEKGNKKKDQVMMPHGEDGGFCMPS